MAANQRTGSPSRNGRYYKSSRTYLTMKHHASPCLTIQCIVGSFVRHLNLRPSTRGSWHTWPIRRAPVRYSDAKGTLAPNPEVLFPQEVIFPHPVITWRLCFLTQIFRGFLYFSSKHIASKRRMSKAKYVATIDVCSHQRKDGCDMAHMLADSRRSSLFFGWLKGIGEFLFPLDGEQSTDQFILDPT